MYQCSLVAAHINLSVIIKYFVKVINSNSYSRLYIICHGKSFSFKMCIILAIPKATTILQMILSLFFTILYWFIELFCSIIFFFTIVDFIFTFTFLMIIFILFLALLSFYVEIVSKL